MTDRTLLLDILGWARPHDSETEHRFLQSYLDPIPGMARDGFGNRHLRIGDAPVMWSCHVDTVAKACGRQMLDYDPRTDTVGLAAGRAGQSLGADDGTGVWLMLGMIEAQRPGLYVFHRGEELGCLGSSWLKKNNSSLLHGIDAAVAFDRAGFGDVITHQSYGRTCSDAFAKSVAGQLNRLCPDFDYQPDDTGVYTDTNEYASLIPECSNLSVGYHGQHGPRETQHVGHAEQLLDAMLRFDFGRCVVERDPAEHDFVANDDPDAYRRAVVESPEVAVAMLQALGHSLDDFLDEAWASDRWEYSQFQEKYA